MVYFPFLHADPAVLSLRRFRFRCHCRRPSRRQGRRHVSVNHLTVAPGGAAFACAAGPMVCIFTAVPNSPKQPPTKRLLGPMDGTVRGWAGGRASGMREWAGGSRWKCASHGRQTVVDLRIDRSFPPPSPPWPQVESLRFDRRGNLLATYNGGLSYWNFERGRGAEGGGGEAAQEKQELPLPYAGACLCGDVTPDLQYIVAGCHDASVHIYHFKEQRGDGVEMTEMTCGGYEAKVTLVDFSPDGTRLASAGEHARTGAPVGQGG